MIQSAAAVNRTLPKFGEEEKVVVTENVGGKPVRFVRKKSKVVAGTGNSNGTAKVGGQIKVDPKFLKKGQTFSGRLNINA